MSKKSILHKKIFALLKTGLNNQSEYSNANVFRRHVLCEIGWVKLVSDDKNEYFDAGSLSFKTCTENDYEIILSKIVSYFIKTLAINQEILSKFMEYEN